MELNSAWVKAPSHSNGRDPLGVQAPCIHLYGRLLPGITNVTDRAIYYLFYPWIVWALKENGHQFDEHFVQRFRRADALLTLLANRHATQNGNGEDIHRAALVGSANLGPQLRKIEKGESVYFDDFAHQRDEVSRYFKNQLGGLGQYYLGVFAEMQVMWGSSAAGVQQSVEIGDEFAKVYDRYVDRELFMQTLEEDAVSVERLDDLNSFCPCQLPSYSEACTLLADMLFVQGRYKEHDLAEQMGARRRTLQSTLHFARALAGDRASVNEFLAATYARTLPNGGIWEVPEGLEGNVTRWATYQRNELLSIAVQGLFHILVKHYRASGTIHAEPNSLVEGLLDSDLVQDVGTEIDLDAPVHAFLQSGQVPPVEDWMHPNHEIQLGIRISDACRERGEYDSGTIVAVLRLLLTLLQREETKRTYQAFGLPSASFNDYPINLATFISHKSDWMKMSARELLRWLLKRWNLDAHFRTALRKFRYVKQSTFLLRPGEYGYEVVSTPDAVHTSPRLKQAMRVLEDIGAINKGGAGVTAFGKSLMVDADE